MTEFDRISPPLEQAIASALRRLAEYTHMTTWDKWSAQSLTPTQRKLLDLLASRRGELSLDTIISELGITPATAADSIGALEARSLVERRSSHVDGRPLGVKLSTEGRRCVTTLAKLPDPLRTAMDALDVSEQEGLYRSAMKVIRTLQEDGLMPTSRMCVRCQYFDPFRYPDSPTPHHCHLVGAPFGDRHLRLDCDEQALASPDAQEALWIRFNSPRKG